MAKSAVRLANSFSAPWRCFLLSSSPAALCVGIPCTSNLEYLSVAPLNMSASCWQARQSHLGQRLAQALAAPRRNTGASPSPLSLFHWHCLCLSFLTLVPTPRSLSPHTRTLLDFFLCLAVWLRVPRCRALRLAPRAPTLGRRAQRHPLIQLLLCLFQLVVKLLARSLGCRCSRAPCPMPAAVIGEPAHEHTQDKMHAGRGEEQVSARRKRGGGGEAAHLAASQRALAPAPAGRRASRCSPRPCPATIQEHHPSAMSISTVPPSQTTPPRAASASLPHRRSSRARGHLPREIQDRRNIGEEITRPAAREHYHKATMALYARTHARTHLPARQPTNTPTHSNTCLQQPASPRGAHPAAAAHRREQNRTDQDRPWRRRRQQQPAPPCRPTHPWHPGAWAAPTSWRRPQPAAAASSGRLLPAPLPGTTRAPPCSAPTRAPASRQTTTLSSRFSSSSSPAAHLSPVSTSSTRHRCSPT